MTRLGSGNLLVRAAYIGAGLIAPGCRHRGCRPTIAGHRGVPREFPENTLLSFERAIARGADAIETDICATADGRFVLWHDADPDERIAIVRQTGGENYAYRPDAPALGSRWRRPVRELSLAELRAHYRLVPDGGRTDGRDGIEIPLLEDLLAWAAGEPRLRRIFLDLKLAPHDLPRALELFEQLRRISAEPQLSHVVLHLLNVHRQVISGLAKAREEAGSPERLRVSADVELAGVVAAAESVGAPDVSLGCGERFWVGFRREVCAAIRARDRGRFGYVAVWTVNGARRLRELAAGGVDAIITDEPETLRRVAAAWQADC